MAAAAAILCFTAAAYAGGGPQTEDKDAPPKPLPPLQKNFPLDQTWSLRELNGKPVPSGVQRQPEDRRHVARLGIHGLQLMVSDHVSGQGSASRHWSLCADQEAMRRSAMALEAGFLTAAYGQPGMGPGQRRPGDQGTAGIDAARPLTLSQKGNHAKRAITPSAPRPASVAGAPSWVSKSIRRLWKAPRVERWPIETTVVRGNVWAMAW